MATKEVPRGIFQSWVTAERMICDSSLNDRDHAGFGRPAFRTKACPGPDPGRPLIPMKKAD
jgi:hypothetical protein